MKAKCKVHNRSIIGANSRKMHLLKNNSYTYNGIQKYRVVKGKVAPPKDLLFVVIQIEKYQHILIEQSVH